MRPAPEHRVGNPVARAAAATTRRALISWAKSLLLLIVFGGGGCAPRPGPEVLEVVRPEGSPSAAVTIDVVTNREQNPATGGYSDRRSSQLSFERFTISVPPDHQVTQIEWPTDSPHPATSFAVTERRMIPTFQLGEAQIAYGNAGQAPRERDVVIFVHGYNYNFQESLFRLAQLAVDGSLVEAPILFAWPSAASVTGYLADRDAITYSRDDLVRLLKIITTNPNVGQITLFGHSMGAMLVTEALRQLRLTGQDRSIERLTHVILAAPDIDIDVFRAQMEVIGILDPPMTLLVAPDDRALQVSAWFAGSRSRIGSRDIRDTHMQAMAAANGIQIIDISELSTPDPIKHSRFVGLVTVFPQLRSEGRATLAQTGAFVLKPLTAVLMPTHR